MMPPDPPRRGGPARRRRCAFALAAALSLAAPAAAQNADTLPDPFSGIVRQQLANGLTVWVRPLPGAGNISISLAVPSGSDRDPPGREELAHVVEHALFSARDGRSQEQITRDIGDRGGSFNASTSPDRTILWVSVAREHGPFALEWLYDRVKPREWDESIMPGVRDAVMLELRLGPRSLLEQLRDGYLLNPRLLPPGFWTREFGLHPPEYRRADVFASVQRTTAADVEAFYRLHYQPPRMTLLVAGDVDPERVFQSVESTFGQLIVWPERPAPLAADVRRSATRRYFWNLRDDVAYGLSFRIDSLGADDHVRLLFAQQLLERRLTRRLRFGAQPAVYGISSALVQRGDIALLRFDARIRPDAWDDARGIIEDEVQRLRHGRYPPGEFEQDRAALDSRLRLNNGSPGALRGWHSSTFYRADLHPVPPPLGQRFAAMTPAELATFARARLGPTQEILSIERPLPLRQGAALALPLLALLLGVAAARRAFVRPIELARLRYVARLRAPLALRVPATLLFVAALLFALRLFAAGAHHVAAALLWSQDSFILQATSFVIALALATFLVLAALALLPRKLLVLDHEARIKYWAYRSTVIDPDDIVELRLAHFGDAFRHRRAWRTVPLAFGWRTPGVLVRTRSGADWFVAVRAPAELLAALARMHARPPLSPDVWLAAAGADS